MSAETPHLNGLARQIADGANRRLMVRQVPSGSVEAIDPVTVALIMALLQFVAKRCVNRELARKSRSNPNKTLMRARRAVANCEATNTLPWAAQMAIAEATAEALCGANEATIDLVEQEIGWAEVADE